MWRAHGCKVISVSIQNSQAVQQICYWLGHQGAWTLAFMGTSEIMVCFGFCFACKFLWINLFSCPVSVKFVNTINL